MKKTTYKVGPNLYFSQMHNKYYKSVYKNSLLVRLNFGVRAKVREADGSCIILQKISEKDIVHFCLHSLFLENDY